MPYKNKPRPYKKEYEQQKERGEHADRMERQRARRAVDKTGADKNKNGKADKREGKDMFKAKEIMTTDVISIGREEGRTLIKWIPNAFEAG